MRLSPTLIVKIVVSAVKCARRAKLGRVHNIESFWVFNPASIISRLLREATLYREPVQARSITFEDLFHAGDSLKMSSRPSEFAGREKVPRREGRGYQPKGLKKMELGLLIACVRRKLLYVKALCGNSSNLTTTRSICIITFGSTRLSRQGHSEDMRSGIL